MTVPLTEQIENVHRDIANLVKRAAEANNKTSEDLASKKYLVVMAAAQAASACMFIGKGLLRLVDEKSFDKYQSELVKYLISVNEKSELVDIAIQVQTTRAE